MLVENNIFKNNMIIDHIFDETVKYITYLENMNKNKFHTISSQPGHTINEYNKNEHSYKYGYGYISGYIDLNNHKLINKLIKLSYNYMVIIQNNTYINDNVLLFSNIPIYPIGNNNKSSLSLYNIMNPDLCYTHKFPREYDSTSMYYVHIQSLTTGNSNIFKDVDNILH